MITYRVIEENLHSCEFESYIAYGISVYSDDTETVLSSISDIFLKKERAEKLAQLCNENSLDPIHLKEVVEDAIG